MIFHVLCRIYEKERNWPYVGWMNSDVLLNKPSKAGNNKILVEVSATQASWVYLIRCLWHASLWNTGYSDLCLWWPVSLKKRGYFQDKSEDRHLFQLMTFICDSSSLVTKFLNLHWKLTLSFQPFCKFWSEYKRDSSWLGFALQSCPWSYINIPQNWQERKKVEVNYYY